MTFPVSTIASVGLGCGLTILVCISVNLTLIPALILTLPSFFATFHEPIQNFEVSRFLRRLLRRIRRWTRRLLMAPINGLMICVVDFVLRRRHRLRENDDDLGNSLSLLSDERNSSNPNDASGNPIGGMDAENDANAGSPPYEDHEERMLISPPEFFENYAQIRKEMERYELLSPRVFGVAKFVTE